MFRRRKKDPPPPEAPPPERIQTFPSPGKTLEMGSPDPPVACAAVQLLGRREEQQDVFFVSPAERFAQEGLLAVLCDGMGGMAEGGAIADETLHRAVSWFHPSGSGDCPRFDEIEEKLRELNADIFNRYREQGGTTLVLVHIFERQATCWFVGDSDLFLRRYGRLYAVNQRQEYRCARVQDALRQGVSVEDAFSDPQAASLTSYIGAAHPQVDGTLRPLPLQGGDTLLLCTDGFSDVLSLDTINAALSRSPEEACRQLERGVLEANLPGQDNATAVVLRLGQNAGSAPLPSSANSQ